MTDRVEPLTAGGSIPAKEPASFSALSANDRIKVMERSLSCFACGLLSLIPILGLPLGVVAVWQFRKSGPFPADANPAGSYRRWGGWLAIVGIGLTLATVLLGAPLLLSLLTDA